MFSAAGRHHQSRSRLLSFDLAYLGRPGSVSPWKSAGKVSCHGHYCCPHVRVHSCASTHISGSLNRCPSTRTHARAQPASSDARTRAHMLTCACSRAGTESMVLSPATSSLAVYACRAPSVRWHTPSERAAICGIQAHMLTQTRWVHAWRGYTRACAFKRCMRAWMRGCTHACVRLRACRIGSFARYCVL